MILILVNGGWENWSNWTSCSATCSAGTKSRTRSCSNPFPKCGGQDCDGKSVDVEPCNEDISCKCDF